VRIAKLSVNVKALADASLKAALTSPAIYAVYEETGCEHLSPQEWNVSKSGAFKIPQKK